MAYWIIGSVWFLVFGGWAVMEQEQRKHKDGTYSPRTILSNIVAFLWFGPLIIGIWVGFEAMGPVVLFPPFAMYEFLQFVFG